MLPSMWDKLRRYVGRIGYRLLCLLTFQYIPPVHKSNSTVLQKRLSKCWSFLWIVIFIITSIVGLAVNWFPTAILSYLIWSCPFDYYHVCYSGMLYGSHNTSTDIPHIILRDVYTESAHDGNSINDTVTDEVLVKFEFSTKLALLLSSLSSSISFLLFIGALGWLFVRPHVNYLRNCEKSCMHSLHPFNDNDYNNDEIVTETVIFSNSVNEDGFVEILSEAKRRQSSSEDSRKKLLGGAHAPRCYGSVSELASHDKIDAAHQLSEDKRRQSGSEDSRKTLLGGANAPGSGTISQGLEPVSDDESDAVTLETEPLSNDWKKVHQLSEDTNTTTQLKLKELGSYVIVLCFNILVNAIVLGIFLGRSEYSPNETELVYNHHLSYYIKIRKWENVVIATYVYSLLCTLSSCFIFSKLAYGVQRKCVRIANYLKDINRPDNDLESLHDYVKNSRRKEIVELQHNRPDESTHDSRRKEIVELQHAESTSCPNLIRLLYLQTRDIYFLKLAKYSLAPFELWFFIHWLLYILTSFFTFSLFIQAIILKIKAVVHVKNNGINFHNEEIALIGFYSLSNCCMFLYPCFRAAAITDSRQALYRKLNKKYSLLAYNASHEITREFLEIHGKFLSYLKSQNFAFNLRIMCLKVPFVIKLLTYQLYLVYLVCCLD